MTPEQRRRHRLLADAELARGNALAAILLDYLDEADGAESHGPIPALEQFGIPTAGPAPQPAPPPTVNPHDLEQGPGGEIEDTSAWPDPTDLPRTFFRS